jgi:hypothetical protein
LATLTFSPRRGVDEAVVADVDADVVDVTAVDAEEHQVARLQVAARHFRPLW